MKLPPIIISLLETDAYKLNMQAIVHKKHNTAMTRWAFRCRNNDVVFTSEMVEEIMAQIDHFCALVFKQDEREWLSNNFPWLGDAYINFLKYWKPDRSQITINEPWHQKYNECGLTIEANGTWLDTMMYEIPILAIVNEVYFAIKFGERALDMEFKNISRFRFSQIVDGKYDIGTFSEFGLRRRYSGEMQDWLVHLLTSCNVKGFVGTSNVYLAKKYGIKAIGTQAHEFFMAYQGLHHLNPAYSNKFALEDWSEFYGTKLGIALTDTIGTNVFLCDFGERLATLFSGVRHDSGDPIEWGEKMIAHYKKLGIDPMTKTLLFSDSLDIPKAANLYAYFKDKAKVAFGIGTAFTCPFHDDPEKHPLNIVMKMVECNGAPVAKISNTPSKGMCLDEAYTDYLRRTIDWRLTHEKEA